jgi:hypothetical protein
MELTEKQKAIQMTLFKDKNDNKFFTINVYKPYTTNEGLKAYYRTGTDCSVYTENALMTAIYTGKYQKGLVHFIACKKQPATIFE